MICLPAKMPQAIALKGKWGRGKSYLWKTYFESRGVEKSRLTTYSYVSLFSLENLGAVRDAIFANAEPIALAGEINKGSNRGPGIKRLWPGKHKALPTASKYTDLLTAIPHLGQLGTLVH